DKSELRGYLVKNLPEYMVPSFYVELDSMPLTSNGKVDRKALPSVTGEDVIKKEYVAPRNEIEEKLVTLIAKILNCKENEIGINDNFFDLGLNSLKLINIVNLIKKEFDLVISISILFEFPNVNELSNKIYNLINRIEAKPKYISENSHKKHEDLSRIFDEFLE
ncbi:phosphopantetheine-binding protein, partial [Flavobacterium sp. ZB4P13]|uniref:phosphopantetheine-binding protein n=1 Tax=Flavobacterium sp. ZB4P13 TaxID=3401728 RepID=UPI003AAEF209